MKTLDIKQSEFDSLVEEVLRRRDQIIPVIGDYCYVGLLHTGNPLQKRYVSLQEWLIENILENECDSSIKNRLSNAGYRGMDEFYETYSELYKRAAGRYITKYDFISLLAKTVENGLENNEVDLRPDVKRFLDLGGFKVIVSTSPFHILEAKLLHGTKYTVSSFAPIVSGNVSRAEAVLKIPSIYQIFGDIEGDCVIGEDDLLQFLHYLNRSDFEKGYGASPLVKYIKDTGAANNGRSLLMPIGCDNLPDWLFRFLWYPFSSDCLYGKDQRNQGGIWHKYASDESFHKFLTDYRFKTLSCNLVPASATESNEDPVLVRLADEFGKQTNDLADYVSETLNVQWVDDEWDVFLSYSSDDFQLAVRIYDALTEKCGLKVWMDKRGTIMAGEKYWDAIQYGIDHSRIYFFLVTDSYLSKAIDRNHKNEITGEIEPTGVYQEIEYMKHTFLLKKRDGKVGYSVPFIISGTKVSYTDTSGKKHLDEQLDSHLLENLHKFDEYKMLQTDALFYRIQNIVCNADNIDETIVKYFKKEK